MYKTLHQKFFFARWQALLPVFDFDIEYIKGVSNSIPDFLTHEFIKNRFRTEHDGAQKEG